MYHLTSAVVTPQLIGQILLSFVLEILSISDAQTSFAWLYMKSSLFITKFKNISHYCLLLIKL